MGHDGRKAFGKLAGMALLGAGFVYASGIEPRWLQVKPVELTLPRLAPEFDGYRVVQIGDLHLDEWPNPAWLARIVKLVNGNVRTSSPSWATSPATPPRASTWRVWWAR